MRLATDYRRAEAYERLEKIAASNSGEIAAAIKDLVVVKDKAESQTKAKVVIDLLNKLPKTDEITQVLNSSDQLPKKSQ
jgi:hypothetical protein